MQLAEGLDMDEVIAGYLRGLRPLNEAEPAGKSARDTDKAGWFSAGLGNDLALLAIKIAPTMSEAQNTAWISVMVTALSDLPGRVSREAAQSALHVPMKFLNEVEGVIREKADVIVSRHNGAVWRLRQLRAAIDAQGNLQGNLAGSRPGEEPDRPLTEAERAHLATNPWGLGDLAVKLGMIEADPVRSSSVIR